MRIAIAASGAGPHALVEPVFGRADFFVILSTENNTHTTITNSFRDAQTKAGQHAASMLLKEEVDVVLCGDIGPKAKLILAEKSVFVGIGYDGTVQEAVQRFTALA